MPAVWPPKGVHLDYYVGNLFGITALMSAITVEWSWHAVKQEDPLVDQINKYCQGP